ncbi:uncharacterized protein ALTATR162_LOCUS8767 [Alternaria atra]|uniref:Uncharacterized protein n=1 Tax=Alternaria atra TaxID=119953 RepID=A0A8J2I715_9PLEO|nr:uncharacterized protein ALTATR162_LOCUS8767 [Alternaria atra]CAG5178570.1 unnamed protein product [Alternaria atra]
MNVTRSYRSPIYQESQTQKFTHIAKFNSSHASFFKQLPDTKEFAIAFQAARHICKHQLIYLLSYIDVHPAGLDIRPCVVRPTKSLSEKRMSSYS